MKIKLLFTLIFLIGLFYVTSIFAVQNSERIYSLSLEYDKGSLKLLEANLITGFPNLATDKNISLDQNNVYELDLFSKSQDLLYQGYFDIPNKVYPEPSQAGPIILDQVTFGLSLPYFKNGQTIKITKVSQELLTIDVSKFQMYCGDGKCQADENHQICSQDCPELLEKGLPPSPPKRKYTDYILYGGIIIVLVILAIFLVKKSRKKNIVG
jgi:predicted nucleic acid-binding Zn ribbon protein